MNKKILIVDDESVNRDILAQILRSQYETLEVDSGAAALNLLRSHGSEISAILLDIVMPVLDGYKVLQAVSGDPLLSTIPILVLTGAAKDGAEEKALSLGAQDFISKPYNAKVLLFRLKNLIARAENNDAVNSTNADANNIYYDPLTKILNRMGFYRAIEPLVHGQGQEQYTIICCNIRNFKIVNEL